MLEAIQALNLGMEDMNGSRAWRHSLDMEMFVSSAAMDLIFVLSNIV